MKIKYSYECEECEKGWNSFGIDYFYCSDCNEFKKANYISKNTTEVPKIFDCNCKLTSNDFLKIVMNPLKSFSKCDFCENFIQGFLYSQFSCKNCNYLENSNGLQKKSNDKCECGDYLVNPDYEQEFSTVSQKNNRTHIGTFLCSTKNCNNYWSDYNIRMEKGKKFIFQICERCSEIVEPYNLQFKTLSQNELAEVELFSVDWKENSCESTSDNESEHGYKNLEKISFNNDDLGEDEYKSFHSDESSEDSYSDNDDGEEEEEEEKEKEKIIVCKYKKNDMVKEEVDLNFSKI